MLGCTYGRIWLHVCMCWKTVSVCCSLFIRLLPIVSLPRTFSNLHIGEEGGKGGFFGGACVNAEGYLVGCCRQVADAHLTEVDAVGGTFDAVVVLAPRETVPHGLDVGWDGGGSPVGITLVGDYAAEVLERFVLIFHGAFEPVLAVEIHNDAALVEAVVALGEVGLDDEAEEWLACGHLQHGGIVVLEMVVSALPEVGVWGCGDGDGVALDFIGGWFASPLEPAEVYGAAVGECGLYVVDVVGRRLFGFAGAADECGSCKDGEEDVFHISGSLLFR